MPRSKAAERQAILVREAVLCRRRLGEMEDQAFRRAKSLEAKGDARQRARAAEVFTISRAAYRIGQHLEEALQVEDFGAMEDLVRRAETAFGNARAYGI